MIQGREKFLNFVLGDQYKLYSIFEGLRSENKTKLLLTII
jgi:hypothetical protein